MARGRKFNPAAKIAARSAFDEHGNPKPGVSNAIIKALDVQRPLVLANLNRYRRQFPEAGPAELAERLEKDYLKAVTTGGATVGAFGIVPGIGTIATLGLSAAATVGFLELTALYAQSIAELHGIPTTDPERAQAMVMAIIMGEEGGALIKEFAGQTGSRGAGRAWGDLVGSSMPSGLVGSLVTSLRRRFLKKLLARQGTALLGRAVPFGIGAVVGGAGNLAMGRRVVATTREAFGELPLVLPMELVGDLALTRQTLPGRLLDQLPGRAGARRRAAGQYALEEQERARRAGQGQPGPDRGTAGGGPETGGDGS